MGRTISIGGQDFETIRVNDYFYIDKTDFIRQWWENGDSVTLLTRPRRFGKTLNLCMVEQFFSLDYAGRSDLFTGLSIWKEETYRNLQGTYPVLFVSFADVKEDTFSQMRATICQIIEDTYSHFRFLLKGDLLSENEKKAFEAVSPDMENSQAGFSLKRLSSYLSRYYGKKVIILLDEYDTPMQEAYVKGYWEEMSDFMRSLFNSTFKTNPYLYRALMTGITRVSRESIFSDFNNPEIVTTTSEKYEECFGFTEEEVFAALEEYGLSEKKEEVKNWYDGFTFGTKTDIYNPWSIIHYLDKKKVGIYWANTSAGSLAGKLIQQGAEELKQDFEILLQGGTLETELNEQLTYGALPQRTSAVWSLLLASGYLKVMKQEFFEETGRYVYTLALTNREVKQMFETMIQGWFQGAAEGSYNKFLKALLSGDEEAMNEYMNRVTEETFSYFDTGTKPSRSEPERFYHGFVLGLMVELAGRYTITSNRESGFGRYDVMLEPKEQGDDAMILEFKVFKPGKEADLEETAVAALAQIEEKNYAAALQAKGIPAERIRKYGFAFEGKTVLIRESHETRL
ncbi:MAG: AAA family ATPase [Firmicutes bacterium]|nr:AAA family ATPase [Bacillota bacterium]